jgi:hypothetical protein
MSGAYMCDACGDYHEGRPSVEVDIDYELRATNGDVMLLDEDTQRTHHVEYDHVETRLELCASCGRDVVEFVGAYMTLVSEGIVDENEHEHAPEEPKT